ncbi:MAG: hypothetical protein GC136_02220 [Alphaproteobacteria bacterium]|nr:hypothetical protein [Alphaproteobacteria bacterium]
MRLVIVLFSLLILSLPVFAADLEKVTIAQFGKEKFLLYLPLYVAMEEKIFEKNGIEVNLKFAGNDDQIFASVISGNADFGMGDPIFTAISKDKGGPGKVVAMMITKLGLSGVTNKPDLKPITDVKALNGLRISSFARPSTTYTLLQEIKRNHKLDDMKIVEGAFGAQIALLEAGHVDIAVDIEPSVSIAEDKGYPVIFSLDKFTEPQAITGLMTTEDVIKAKPETVQKVVSSLQEAVTLIHESPDASLRTATALYPDLSEKVIRAALARMVGLGIYPDNISIPDALWQSAIKTRLESGELKKPQETNIAVDNSFADTANASH